MNVSDVNVSSVVLLKHNIYVYAVPMLALLCVVSTAANCYILVSVRWLVRSPSPTLRFTLSLCAADAWVSLMMAVGFIFQSYLPYVFGVRMTLERCMGLALEAFRMGAMITSILHLLALALNHYIGITRPLHYSTLVTPELCMVAIAVLWIVPSLSLLIFFSIVPHQAFLSSKCRHVHFFHSFVFRASIGTFIFVPLFLMFIVYMHIFSVVVKRKTHVAHNLIAAAKSSSNAFTQNIKAIVTTSLILGTYTIGWVPGMVQFVLICNDGCLFHTGSIPPMVVIMVSLVNNTLIILKALCDAIIYAWRVREIRAAIVNMHNAVCSCRPVDPQSEWRESIRLTSIGDSTKSSNITNGYRHVSLPLENTTLLNNARRFRRLKSCSSSMQLTNVLVSPRQARKLSQATQRLALLPDSPHRL